MPRILLSLLFMVAGTLHFAFPGTYLKIMPPFVPAPLAMIFFSGAAEILGAIGLLAPSTRQAAAWGLVALLVCVWPANIYMVLEPGSFPGIPLWAIWARIPLQIPLIWWAWLYTRR